MLGRGTAAQHDVVYIVHFETLRAVVSGISCFRVRPLHRGISSGFKWFEMMKNKGEAYAKGGCGAVLIGDAAV